MSEKLRGLKGKRAFNRRLARLHDHTPFYKLVGQHRGVLTRVQRETMDKRFKFNQAYVPEGTGGPSKRHGMRRLLTLGGIMSLAK